MFWEFNTGERQFETGGRVFGTGGRQFQTGGRVFKKSTDDLEEFKFNDQNINNQVLRLRKTRQFHGV